MSAKPLLPKQVRRLEEALGRHLTYLRKALTDSERDQIDLHFQLAGQLRVLLCDSDVPILLAYAAHKGLGLRIWGPNPPGFVGRANAFQFNSLVASPHPVEDSYEMLIDEYLNTPIGGIVVPDQGGGRPETLWYTPKQLIKWVANREGVAHLDLDAPRSLQAVQDAIEVTGTVTLQNGTREILRFGANDQFLVRSALLQISLWTVDAIGRVLVAPSR